MYIEDLLQSVMSNFHRIVSNDYLNFPYQFLFKMCRYLTLCLLILNIPTCTSGVLTNTLINDGLSEI